MLDVTLRQEAASGAMLQALDGLNKVLGKWHVSGFRFKNGTVSKLGSGSFGVVICGVVEVETSVSVAGQEEQQKKNAHRLWVVKCALKLSIFVY